MTPPTHRPRVYVAGPYSQGVPGRNVQHALRVAARLIEAGYAPLVPHLAHFIHDQYPQRWETWLEVDEAWVAVSQAVLRMRGESKGADRECELARSLGIPVVYTVPALRAALAGEG